MGPHWRAMEARLDTYREIKTNLLMLNNPGGNSGMMGNNGNNGMSNGNNVKNNNNLTFFTYFYLFNYDSD